IPEDRSAPLLSRGRLGGRGDTTAIGTELPRSNERRCRLSAVKANVLRARSWPWYVPISRSARAAQSVRVPSWLPVASPFSSGLRARLQTGLSLPRNSRRGWPVSRSQRRTIGSGTWISSSRHRPAVISDFPVGLNATREKPSPPPLRDWRTSPVLASQTLISGSNSDAETSRLPSGL